MATYIAKTFYGLEHILSQELEQIGAKEIKIQNRAVQFEANKIVFYKANMYLRTALKILMPILEFTAQTPEELYEKTKELDWTKYLTLKKTFAIDTVAFSTHFTHTHYVSLKVKDAIVDFFREKFNERPTVNPKNPQIRINVYIQDEKISIALDGSGETLNRRGYRVNAYKAPLNEVLAAGMIMLSEWNPETSFIDPMCGSGTLLTEAAMIALKIPPGYYRKRFGFQNWLDFVPALWIKIKQDAQKTVKENADNKINIIGADLSKEAISATEQNLQKIKLLKYVKLFNKPFDQLQLPKSPGTLIINPPYGERIDHKRITSLYATIGDTLKQTYKNYKAWILSSNNQAIKSIGLHPDKKIKLYNGQLECQYLKYLIYEGTKKKHS